MQNVLSFIFSDRRNLKMMATKFGKENLPMDEMCAVRMQKQFHSYDDSYERGIKLSYRSLKAKLIN